MPETIEQLRAENAKLRDENERLGGPTTMMGCKACGHGVRPRYAVAGMCGDCAERRMKALESLYAAARAFHEDQKAGVPESVLQGWKDAYDAAYALLEREVQNP